MGKYDCRISHRVNGDSCRYCQPQEYINLLIEWLKDAREETDSVAEERNEIEEYSAELKKRLAAAESKLDELDRELFFFAHDVMCFENDKMPDWVFEKAKAIYGRLCLGKGE